MSLLQPTLHRAVRQQQCSQCGRRWPSHPLLKVIAAIKTIITTGLSVCTLQPHGARNDGGHLLQLCSSNLAGPCRPLQVARSAVANIDTQTAVTGSRDMSQSLTLANIRSSLIRQEDSIIFNYIERAQFALNPSVYKAGGIQVPGEVYLHECRTSRQRSATASSPVYEECADRSQLPTCQTCNTSAMQQRRSAAQGAVRCRAGKCACLIICCQSYAMTYPSKPRCPTPALG